MNQKLKKSIYISSTVFLAAIALVLLISLLPLKKNYKLFVVTSGSMEPNIRVGSISLVVPSNSYKIRDIITFKDPGSYEKEPTTHRIIATNNFQGQTYFQTKGDANNAPDKRLVANPNIIGKSYFSIPLIGYIVGYAKTLTGLIILIIVPATLIIYEQIRKIIADLILMRSGTRRTTSF